MMLNHIVFFFAAISFSLLFSGCGKEEPIPQEAAPVQADPPPEYVVAMVNDVPLTWKEMDDRATAYLNEQVRKNHLLIPEKKMEEAKTHFRKQSVKAFVYKTILLSEANRAGISLTEQDKQKNMQQFAVLLKQRNLSTNDFFNNGPVPPDEMRAEMENGFLIDKYFKVQCEKKVKSEKGEVEKVIQEIVATNEWKMASLEKVKKQIEGGASFEEFAKSISDDHRSNTKGGDLGEISRRQLTKVLDDAIFSLPIGKLSDVLISRSGYHLVKVTSRMSAKPKTETTPAVAESAHVFHIFLKKVPINRKQILDAILRKKYAEEKRAHYLSLLKKAKISCFLYPDLTFQ